MPFKLIYKIMTEKIDFVITWVDGNDPEWRKERNVLDKTSRSRFRTNENVTQWLIKNWQFMKGQFEPISPKYTEYYGLGSAIADITKDIKENKHKVICINDTDMNYDFEKAKSEVIRAFEEKFPRKCSYEL